MSKSTKGLRKAGIASIAVSLTLGASAMGAGAANAVEDFSFDRIPGENRYHTSALIADEYNETNTHAILAPGEHGKYADALSANLLAGATDSPILLTRSDFTPQYVLDQLEDQDTERITVVGGDGVISDEQVAALRAEGYTVTRVAGPDRFDTNAEVIEASDVDAVNGVGLIATGFDFADALAGGPVSYQGHPLGLSTKDDIEDDVIDALKAAGVESVYILGGEAAVGAAVATKLEANGIDVAGRLAGANRAATSVEIAEFALENLDFVDTHVGVASGYVEGSGADALAGGPLEGQEMSPMLVTRNENNPGEVLGYLEDNCETLEDGHLYGGTAAITAAAESAMTDAAQCEDATPTGSIAAPELLSFRVVDAAEGSVVYTFDSNVEGTSGIEERFRLYNFGGQAFEPDDIRVSGNQVFAQFDAALLQNATVATVRFAAVTDQNGLQNPEAAVGVQNIVQAAGITDDPDLVSVGNYRTDALGNQYLDFTFDETVPVAAYDGGNFGLVLSDGDIRTGIAAGVTDNDGDEVLTVNFGNVAADEIAFGQARRGFAEGGAGGVNEVTQTVDLSNNGNSDDPDLVSATLQASGSVRFLFDEAVEATITDENGFWLYDATGAQISSATATRVAGNSMAVDVTFADAEAVQRSVGAGIDEAVVTAVDDNDPNRLDEVALQGVTFEAGKTTLPDLVSVSVTQATVSQNYTVTFTFDEAVAAGDVEAGDLYLYDENGNRFIGAGTVGDDDGDAVITMTTPGNFTAAQVEAAVWAAVADADNGDDGDATTVDNPLFPEGGFSVDAP